MRIIKRTAAFRRDYRRTRRTFQERLDADLVRVLDLLAADQPMPRRYRDHALTGGWKRFRDCHIHPDLVLIYQKPDPDYLVLVRLGTHSQLGL